MFPHVKLVELYNDGVMHEVAVIKEDGNGDLYFIRADYLDEIDRIRLRQILSRRDANRYPLWDLLSQQTLPNGVNALEFFHQFVKVRSASGKIFTPGVGRIGAGRPKPIMKADLEKAAAAEQAAAQAAKKGPGRPPKAAETETAEG